MVPSRTHASAEHFSEIRREAQSIAIEGRDEDAIRVYQHMVPVFRPQRVVGVASASKHTQ
jgi:hypothetical protein